MSGPTAHPPDTSFRAVGRLASSALVVLVAEPLYLLEDLAVVGRLGAAELAALGVGTVILGVVSTQLTFLSYGTTARSARMFGAGDRPAAVGEGVAASWLAVGVGVVIVAVVQIGAPIGVGAIASDASVAADAVGWLRIAVCGVPLILVSMAGNGWMRGVRDTRRPVVYVSVGVAVSAVLCPALVHGLAGAPHLGLPGSAIANVVGQLVAGTLFATRVVIEAMRSSTPAERLWNRLRPRRGVIRAQLVLARDLVVRSLSFQVCFLSATAVAARFGVAALAAHQVVLQLWNTISLLLDALAIAAQSLVGAALGADHTQSALDVARRVTAGSVAVAGVVMAVLGSGRVPIAHVLTDDPAVLDSSATPWWFLVAMLPVAGVVFALDGVLLGSGDAAYLRTATIVAALAGFLPLIWMSLAWDWGLAGIWAGLATFMTIRLLAVLHRVRGQKWTQVRLAAAGR